MKTRTVFQEALIVDFGAVYSRKGDDGKRDLESSGLDPLRSVRPLLLGGPVVRPMRRAARPSRAPLRLTRLGRSLLAALAAFLHGASFRLPLAKCDITEVQVIVGWRGWSGALIGGLVCIPSAGVVFRWSGRGCVHFSRLGLIWTAFKKLHCGPPASCNRRFSKVRGSLAKKVG